MNKQKAPLTQKQLANQDFFMGLKRFKIWFFLAYQDIRLRYRRSILGPFWLTLSMAITVYSMGFLYAHLFRVDMQSYYPHLVASMLGWSLISSILIEATDTYVLGESLLRQIKLPYCLYIHRMIARNIFIFFHNLIVMIPVLILFHEKAKINFFSLLLIPNLLFLYLSAFFFSNIIAMIGARYRDISQMIKSLVQVVFFVTPVMWMAETLPEKYAKYIFLNPFYSYLEILRAPLLGRTANWICWAIVAACTLFCFMAHQYLFTKYRSRIIYWI